VGLIGLERVDANDGELPPPTVVRSHFRCPVVKLPRFLVRLGGPFSRPGLNVARLVQVGIVIMQAGWVRASIRTGAALVSPGRSRGAARR